MNEVSDFVDVDDPNDAILQNIRQQEENTHPSPSGSRVHRNQDENSDPSPSGNTLNHNQDGNSDPSPSGSEVYHQQDENSDPSPSGATVHHNEGENSDPSNIPVTPKIYKRLGLSTISRYYAVFRAYIASWVILNFSDNKIGGENLTVEGIL